MLHTVYFRGLIGAAALVLVAAAAWPFVGDHRVAVSSAPAVAPHRREPEVLRFPVDAPQLASVQTTVTAASALPMTDVLSARVVYDEDATARIGVGIAGRIIALKAAPGDSVRAGQVLAEIDSPDLGTALADLDKARADEQRKRLLADRAKELVSGEAIAAKDWDALQADLAQAHAETVRAAQRVKNLNPQGLRITGQHLNLTSPIAGVVAERNATPALEVSASLSAPLFVITQPQRLWLMIDLPESLLGRLKPGGQVEVESDAYPGTRFLARLAHGAQLVDPNTRRVTVRALLDNPDGKLLPEMFVRARLLQSVGKGVPVPNSALVHRGVNTYVFVQTAAGEFVRRRVVLLTQGGDTSYVGAGLAGGEHVVTGGALLLDAELNARANENA